jgi:uncharacterized protein YrrD
MLKNIRRLEKFSIHATDGDLGRVEDCYFDDDKWTIRYFVVHTGKWLFGQHVLVSPFSVSRIDWEEKKLCVNLTMDQVKNSPDISTDQPISRQKESEFHFYYDFPAYWGGTALWGTHMSPAGALLDHDAEAEPPETGPGKHSSHLRSTREVTGYRVYTVDSDAGKAADFIFDQDTWAFRYLVIDTSHWLPGKKVVVPVKLVDRVIWSRSKVNVNIARDRLQYAPPLPESGTVVQEYEETLFAYYHLHPYWEEDSSV